MKMLSWLVPGMVLAALAGGARVASSPKDTPSRKEKAESPARAPFEVAGRTQCMIGKKGTIAPVPLHPVEEVYVRPGQRVKKGDKLVLIDDDEPKADLRVKTANWEGARVSLKEARRLADQADAAYRDGALPATTYFTARSTLLKAEQDERAAKAAMESSKFELEHYLVVSMVDGVVAWLDVHPGMVSRPGTTTWGEILDLSELDVRCEVTPEQADRVAVNQAAEVRARWKKTAVAGKVVFIGIAADKVSGLVPVLVRIPNAKGAFRCEIPVQVRFTEALAASPDH